MPGHKFNAALLPEIADFFGEGVVTGDLNEAVPSIDYLHAAVDTLFEAQRLAAAAVGADHTFFLINGSTAGNQAMLMAAAAQKFGMFLCVQDLTCPGASLIHSAGIAARVPGNAGIEANARQFVPSANEKWDTRFPGLFTIHDGMMNTGQLTGPGLGAVPPRA